MRDYLRGEETAAAFYGGRPFEMDSFRRKLREVERRFGREERRRAAAALRPTSSRAAARLERFVEEGGAMITTGQQTGLFTGPLYTVYKALTAVRLADRLEQELGVLVLPVFWSASEDHDWAEVNHAYLDLEREGIRRLELADGPEVALPMSDVRLGEQVRTVLDELQQSVAGDGDVGDALKSVLAAYRPEATVADAFAELMAELLSPFDAYVTDAAHPVVKQASAPLLLRALERAPEQEAVLEQRTRALLEAGYHGQVGVLPGATNVFYHGDAGRERLYLRDGRYVAQESGTEFDARSLRERIESDPRRFSPNVLLRPVVESAVFPTLAYVGGPGEISYFAQLSGLFPEFGMEPPVAYPRASLLLVEMPMQRLLEKLDLEPEALAMPRHELVEQLAQGLMPEEVRTTLDQLSHAVTEGYRQLISAAVTVDPTLEGALARLRNEALVRVGESERKVAQHVKRKEGVRISQLDRLLTHLRPEGEPQDRVLNVVPFLARYGLGLLQQMAEAIPVEIGG